ncbi:hypothetical protein WMY93_029460 [Mugilogobius chulae]|uniref:Butyrophilin subfamily 3 member A2-like Ig-C domain-containing protein n=1 Tax=Mugilogobius chulae TaxID=88201 RepID=A0AAW0N316_9GOBI
MDRERNVIIAFGLNISHTGLYTCHFQKNESSNVEEADIKLTMAANYSKPTLHLQNCTDKEDQCLVRCSSHGGYPQKEITWNGLEGRLIDTIKSSFTKDNNRALYNISSMALFNCSTRKLQNISCSVDDVSEPLFICE